MLRYIALILISCAICVHGQNDDFNHILQAKSIPAGNVAVSGRPGLLIDSGYTVADMINSSANITSASDGAILGDSTIDAYAGQDAVSVFLLKDADSINGSTLTNLAVAGQTTAEQLGVWTNYPARSTLDWVVTQTGLNDITPTANINDIISGYQTYINTIRSDAPNATLIISTMTPAYSRYVDVYGAVGGATCYSLWQQLNQAISGSGATPITNVDMRVTSHTDVLNDGSGNLDSVYDTGDKVHETDAARAIIAAEMRRALNSADYLLPSPASWYRDDIIEDAVIDLEADKLDLSNGTAYNLTVDGGIQMNEASVKIVPGWTNSLPCLAVTIGTNNYVISTISVAGLSLNAPAWYDLLTLSSIWPVDDGAGSTLDDANEVQDATINGGYSWITVDGADAVDFDGSTGYASLGDVYDVGTNDFMLGCWFYMPENPGGNQGLISKASGSPWETTLYVTAGRVLTGVCRNGSGTQVLSLVGSSPVSTGEWHHAALVVNRGVGSDIILDGETYQTSATTLSGLDFQNSNPMVFGSRLLATTYFNGYLGSVQIDVTGTTTNDAVDVWNAGKSNYGR